MRGGWQTRPIGEVFRVVNGGTPKTGVPDYWDGPHAWITPAEMGSRDTPYIAESRRTLTDAGLRAGAELVPAGSIILSTRAPIGHLVINEVPMAFNQGCKGLVPSEYIDTKFAYYFLMANVPLLETLGTGATFKELSGGKLKEVPMAFPSMPEQQRIVAILDQAFAGIAIAKANAQANLRDAEATRVAFLRSVFDHRGSTLATGAPASVSFGVAATERDSDLAPGVTRTGGRAAALRHIPGDFSLSVGMPARGARPGWRWVELAQLARLESGHTPSRRHPEYWGGDIPWLSIRDAREHHGGYVADTEEKTNALGIANSSARVLPAGTVCLSRTASVGYVTVTRNAMATSQDFVNWVCSPDLSPEFLKYVFLAEGRDGLLRFASGAVHQTIYFPEAKAFHICCPDRSEQDRIVARCDAVTAEARRLAGVYQRKLAALDELKQSLLHRAFSGQL